MPNRADKPETAPLTTGASEHHIGAELRARRLAMGQSPADIANALKIQESYIIAIEALDVKALPAIGYVLGFVRSYADLVGLDGAGAVRRYKSDSATPEDLGRRKMPHFVPQRKIRLPRGFVPALTVLACAGVLTFWYSSSTPSIASNAPITDMLDEADYVPETLPDDPTILTLKAVAPTWVQVSDAAGRPVMSRIMVTGESWSAAGDRALTLSVRDGAAIELYAGRERLGAFGEKGVAFTNKPLAREAIIPALADSWDAPEQTEMTPIVTD